MSDDHMSRARGQARRRKQLKTDLVELKAKQKTEVDELKGWHTQERADMEAELETIQEGLLSWHSALMRDDPDRTHVDLGYATVKKYQPKVPNITVDETMEPDDIQAALAKLAAMDPMLVLGINPHKTNIKNLIKDGTCTVNDDGRIVDTETGQIMIGVTASYDPVHTVATNTAKGTG